MLPLVASLRSAAPIRYASQHTTLLLRHVTAHSQSRGKFGAGSWQYAAAACGAAAVAGLLSADLVPVAHGDTLYENEVTQEAQRKKFKEWMAANGADWTAAEVKPCQVCIALACKRRGMPWKTEWKPMKSATHTILVYLTVTPVDLADSLVQTLNNAALDVNRGHSCNKQQPCIRRDYCSKSPMHSPSLNQQHTPQTAEQTSPVPSVCLCVCCPAALFSSLAALATYSSSDRITAGNRMEATAADVISLCDYETCHGAVVMICTRIKMQ